MSRSIRRNILIILLVAQGVLTALCASALVFYVKRQRVAVFDAEMQRRIGALVTMIQVDDSEPTGLAFVPQLESLVPDDLYVIKDLKGSVIASSPHSTKLLEQSIPASKSLSFFSRGQPYRGRVIHAIPVIDSDEEELNKPVPQVNIAYAIPAADFDAASLRIDLIAILGSLFWIASSCFIAWFSVTKGMLPLDELANQASAITERRWTLRLSPQVREVDELRPLALALEALVARLGAEFERERTFVSDAAHELKTVVAIQKSSLQVALQGPAIASRYRAGLERASEDVDRLNVLVHRMLSLASIESSDRTRIDEPVSLDETILGACDQLRSVAAAHRVTLQPQLAASCLIASEEGLLQTLWVTLLENAIRYSKPDSAIQIFCVLENRLGIVTVQDHGAGIAKEYLPHIFERFYRADASRSRDSGGFGLGLAIAKAIVKRHNGRIEVKSEPGLGTTVQIALPCVENLH